jgi:hypothetical protein
MAERPKRECLRLLASFDPMASPLGLILLCTGGRR